MSSKIKLSYGWLSGYLAPLSLQESKIAQCAMGRAIMLHDYTPVFLEKTISIGYPRQQEMYTCSLVPTKLTKAQLTEWLGGYCSYGKLCVWISCHTFWVFFFVNFCHFNVSSLILSLPPFLFHTADEQNARTPRITPHPKTLPRSLLSYLAAFRCQQRPTANGQPLQLRPPSPV